MDDTITNSTSITEEDKDYIARMNSFINTAYRLTLGYTHHQLADAARMYDRTRKENGDQAARIGLNLMDELVQSKAFGFAGMNTDLRYFRLNPVFKENAEVSDPDFADVLRMDLGLAEYVIKPAWANIPVGTSILVHPKDQSFKIAGMLHREILEDIATHLDSVGEVNEVEIDRNLRPAEKGDRLGDTLYNTYNRGGCSFVFSGPPYYAVHGVEGAYYDNKLPQDVIYGVWRNENAPSSDASILLAIGNPFIEVWDRSVRVNYGYAVPDPKLIIKGKVK